MVYKAKLTVTGAPYDEYQNYFFNETIEVAADTPGAAYDGLVEAALVLHDKVILFIMERFGSDYSMDKDSWYATEAFPAYLHEPDEEGYSGGAGSRLHDTNSLVSSITHSRHLEIQSFLTGRIKYLRDGYYLHYVEHVKPAKDFYSSLNDTEAQDIPGYGFLGTQLDGVIAAMGNDFAKLQKDITRHQRDMQRVRSYRVANQKKSRQRAPHDNAEKLTVAGKIKAMIGF